MASSVVKILVFFVLDIQGFAKSGQNNRIHGLYSSVLLCGPSKSDFIGMMEKNSNQLSSSGFGSVTKGTPSSASSAVSLGVAVPWMGRSSVLP